MFYFGDFNKQLGEFHCINQNGDSMETPEFLSLSPKILKSNHGCPHILTDVGCQNRVNILLTIDMMIHN